MPELITVDISDMKIAESPDVLATFALGSCIAICLYDPTLKIGALGHIMLPNSPLNSDNFIEHRFANTCIPKMIEEMRKHNCNKYNLVANIVGGANMIKSRMVKYQNSDLNKIGTKNINAVKRALKDNGITLLNEDTGGDYARTVYFDTSNGKISIKNCNREINTLYYKKVELSNN